MRFHFASLLLGLVLPLGGLADDRPRPPGTIRVVFAGDVMLDRIPGREVERGGDPLAGVATILDEADIAVANLECVVATGGEPVEKPYNFRAHPRCLPLLARHLDAVSLANNHTGDFGKAALVEMIERLERAGLPYFGAGRDQREAHTPLILERAGVRVALLGYDEFKPRAFEAGPSSPGVAWSVDEQVVADITAASRVADVVIPFLHMGYEYESEPNDRQRALARLMIDAGADAVVGGHPHVTQGADVYKGRPIVYSLGNFVFDDFEDVDEGLEEAARTGWILRIDVGQDGVVAWDTVVTRTDDRGFPRPVPDASGPHSPPIGGADAAGARPVHDASMP
jgi:hypothetical protein